MSKREPNSARHPMSQREPRFNRHPTRPREPRPSATPVMHARAEDSAISIPRTRAEENATPHHPRANRFYCDTRHKGVSRNRERHPYHLRAMMIWATTTSQTKEKDET